MDDGVGSLVLRFKISSVGLLCMDNGNDKVMSAFLQASAFCGMQKAWRLSQRILTRLFEGLHVTTTLL